MRQTWHLVVRPSYSLGQLGQRGQYPWRSSVQCQVLVPITRLYMEVDRHCICLVAGSFPDEPQHYGKVRSSRQLYRPRKPYSHPLSAVCRITNFLFQVNEVLDRYQLVTVA